MLGNRDKHLPDGPLGSYADVTFLYFYHNIMVYSLWSSELASTSAHAAKTDCSADVIGRTFNTPLRASAVANLAQKDKSAQKSTAANLAQKLAAESVETSSRASSIPGDAHDVARGYARE